jgi:hypothetical protein
MTTESQSLSASTCWSARAESCRTATRRKTLGSERGGSRAIYYFHNVDVPLFLMAIFAKNIQVDLSARQRVALARQLRALKSDWKKKGTK